jgi:toxin ParE1/3/4
MAVILKRPLALSDLAEIWAYIAADSQKNADAFAALIHTKLQMLARRPRVGRARSELGRDLRSFPVGSYVIFYVPITKGIEIIRVLHGARDIDALFQQEGE